MEKKPSLQTDNKSRIATGQGHPHHSDEPIKVNNPEPTDIFNQEKRGFTEKLYGHKCDDPNDHTGRVQHALENLWPGRTTSRPEQNSEPMAVKPLEGDGSKAAQHGAGVKDRHYLGPSPVPVSKPKTR
jgi:hypothetical protein